MHKGTRLSVSRVLSLIAAATLLLSSEVLSAPTAQAAPDPTLRIVVSLDSYLSSDGVTPLQAGQTPEADDYARLQVVVVTNNSIDGPLAKYPPYIEVFTPDGKSLLVHSDNCAPVPGAVTTVTCYINYQLTDEDITAGQLDLQIQADAYHPNGTPYFGTGPATQNVQIPLDTSLSFKKTANPAILTTKDTNGKWNVEYTFEVSYTGNTDLHNVTVTDPLFQTEDNIDGTILCAVGDSTNFREINTLPAPSTTGTNTTLTCKATYEFDPNALDDYSTDAASIDLLQHGSHPNVATLNATYTKDGVEASIPAASSAATIYIPQLSLTKTAVSSQAITKIGDAINYTFDVTNNGGMTVDYVGIIDNKLESNGNPLTDTELNGGCIIITDLANPDTNATTVSDIADVSLNPGETLRCLATYTVTAADFTDLGTNNCKIINQAQAIAYYRMPPTTVGVTVWPKAQIGTAQEVTVEADPASTTVEPQLGLDVQPINQTFTVAAGSDSTYSFTITNESAVGVDGVGSAPIIKLNGVVVTPTPDVSCTGNGRSGADPFLLNGSGVSMDPAATMTCSFTVPTSDSDLPGPLTATLQVGGSSDSVCVTQPGTVTSNVASSKADLAHLTVTKEVDQAAYVIGDSLTYTITAKNDGGVDVQAILSDQIPDQITVDNATCEIVDDVDPCDVPDVSNGGLVSGSINLPMGSTVNYTITGTVNGAGPLSNIASFTISADDCLSNPCGSYEASVKVNEISVHKTGSDESVSLLPGAVFAIHENDSGNLGSLIKTLASTDSSGQTSVAIMPGTYWLVETQAPLGYQLLPDARQFAVSTDGIVSLTSDQQVSLDISNNNQINVVDYTILETLPVTGGQPSLPLPAIGLGVLLLASGGVLYRYRRLRT